MWTALSRGMNRNERQPSDLSHIAARLLGLRLFGDVHERCLEWGFSLPMGKKRSARHDLIRERKLLFIHVPKNAGTAVCHALYGQEMEHRSIRYFRSLGGFSDVRSVAIIRDPVERFVSAYRHAIGGGGRHRDLAETFHDEYRSFRSLDDALDHVERARGDWYQVDHVFRPQSWYVTDRKGNVAVDHLFHISDMRALSVFLFPAGNRSIPTLNQSLTPSQAPSASQIARIRTLYAQDYEIQGLALAGRDTKAAA